MKTYTQLIEDIKKRRLQLAQRQKESVRAFKERVAPKGPSFAERQKNKRHSQLERENLKRQIKRELQTEQSPVMHQTPFNVMKAREQAKGGIAHRKHVHGEIARQSSQERQSKKERINTILSHE